MVGAIALIVGVVLAALLVYAATRPKNFRVQRSVTMHASPERIFPLINDFQSWPLWSPYEKLNPAMKRTYTGPRSGPGAASSWDGNSKAGAGKMEIVSLVPASKLVVKLDFSRPFEGHNTAEFTLDRAGDNTTVTWAMFGPQNFMLKLISIFMNMDRLMGKEFEEGLHNLKTLTESAQTAAGMTS